MSRHSSPTSVLSLGARATGDVAAEVRRWWSEALSRGARLLVIDLAAASYVDSGVFAALVDGLPAATARGADIVLAAPRTPVRVLIELTRLHTQFDVYDTVDEALGARSLRVLS